MSASLVWNLDFEISGADPEIFSDYTAELHNLDLLLYDATGSTLFASSVSEWDSSENLWFPLAAQMDYRLTVAPGDGQSPFAGDYALAWQVSAVPLPASVWLMGTTLLGLALVRRRQPRRG